MKEQDAAHSFEKKYKNKPDVIRILDNVKSENADLKTELTRLRSELQNLDSIRKEEFRVLSRENAKLTSELQQERELRKELIQGLHQINNLTIINSITVGSAVGAKIKEISESLIEKSKAK